MDFENLSADEKEISRALARELEKVYAQTPYWSMEKLQHEYKTIQDKYIALTPGKPHLQQETRRRALELAFYSAIERDEPVERCESFLAKLTEEGFAAVERKANVLIVLSRYYYKTGENGKANATLLELRTELEKAMEADPNDLYQWLLGIISDLLKTNDMV